MSFDADAITDTAAPLEAPPVFFALRRRRRRGRRDPRCHRHDALSSHADRAGVYCIITDDRDMQKLLRSLATIASGEGGHPRFDSPGGTTDGGGNAHIGLRQLAAKKPVVATLGTVAASGRLYRRALRRPHRCPRQYADWAIGVLFEFAGLMEKLGIEVQSVKSAPLKENPRPSQLEVVANILVVSHGFSASWYERASSTQRRRRNSATAASIRAGKPSRTSWSTKSVASRKRSSGSDHHAEVPTGLPYWAPEREDEE